ncbi:hypothetical protein D3C78_1364770 [compost metagenome]
MFIDNRHFDVACFIGNDAKTGHFRGGAGGGVDGNHRQLRFGGAIDTFIILDLSAVGRDQRDAFGTVVWRAAAKRNYAVTAVFLQQRQALFHVKGSWVRVSTVINAAFDLLRGE